jgi:O-antigen/teichoic acid export membrane protein
MAGAVSESVEAALQPPRHFLNLAKQALVYGTSGVLLQVVGVVTLPVFARSFSHSEYGLLELALVLFSLSAAVADAGFASAAQRSFFDYTESDAEARRRVIFTAFTFTLGVATAIAVVLLLARRGVADALFRRAGETELVALVAVSVPLVIAANFLRETMRLRFRAWHYVISSVASAAVSAAVAVTAVLALDVGVEAIFFGIIVGNGVAVAYGLLIVHSDIGRRFSRPELRKMLVYGMPLVPTAIAVWALALLDRLLLGWLSDLSEVGQYAVANRISGVLFLLVTGFVLAFGPYVLSIYSEDPELEKVVRGKTLTYVTIGLSLGALCLTLFARELLMVAAPSFDEAYRAVGPLSFGVLALGISSVVMAGISISRRTIYFALLSGIGVAVNVAFNLILIPPFGMLGAAFATAAAYGVLTVLHYKVAQRLYPTPYEPKNVLIVVLLATVFGILGVIGLGSLPVALAIKALAVAAFLIALRLTGVVSNDEIDRIRDLVGGRLRLSKARA